jgi:hypothetical protein
MSTCKWKCHPLPSSGARPLTLRNLNWFSFEIWVMCYTLMSKSCHFRNLISNSQFAISGGKFELVGADLGQLKEHIQAKVGPQVLSAHRSAFGSQLTKRPCRECALLSRFSGLVIIWVGFKFGHRFAQRTTFRWTQCVWKPTGYLQLKRLSICVRDFASECTLASPLNTLSAVKDQFNGITLLFLKLTLIRYQLNLIDLNHLKFVFNFLNLI